MYKHFIILGFISVISACYSSTNSPKNALHTTDKLIIIAHRGASGFLPEHTKEAAVLSFMQGADYIEQDIVVSKDKQLIVLHDIHLETVTNVENLFSERKRADGHFYVIDFTLKELRALSVHERETNNNHAVFPSRYQGNAHFTIATFAEHVELINNLNRTFNKNIGLFTEIKSAAWHESQGVDITELFVAEFNRLKLNEKGANVYLQSFDPRVLKRLRYQFDIHAKLLQLIAPSDWSNAITAQDIIGNKTGLQQIAEYAHAIGPYLPQVIDLKTHRRSELAANAKSLNLSVFAYTFRSDVLDSAIEPEEAFKLLRQSGIDGLFTDQVMPYMFAN